MIVVAIVGGFSMVMVLGQNWLRCEINAHPAMPQATKSGLSGTAGHR